MNKRELPNSEFQDFLQTYDETMWQSKEEEEKKAADIAAPKTTLEAGFIDGIKEEEGEGSGDSDEEVDKTKQDSPGASSMGGSERNLTMVGEGDDNEDTFMPLDEALEAEFDINKVSKLD